MGRQQVFTVPTTLYHPVEGPRVFPAGETDPGAAWSDNPGGDRSETSMPNVMKDLIEANDRADALGLRMESMAHDMAQTAAEATEAKESLAAMEQRAITAEGGQKDAEEAAAGYMEERDAARAELTAANDKLGKATADLETAQAEAGKVEGLSAQLDTANQTIANQKDEIAKLTADLAAATAPATAKPNKGATPPEAPAEPAAEGDEAAKTA